MAVDVTLLNSNSLTNINTNFERIKTALQESLGRGGDVPNYMSSDLDMNSNDVLNVGRIDVQEFYMDGTPIISIPEIQSVLAIATDIHNVAVISTQVVVVANNITSINTTSSNIAAIIAAPAAAIAAAASATAANNSAIDAAASAVLAAAGSIAIPQGRLTLSSVTAIPDSDITGAGTIYYLPSGGGLLPIYDGTKFVNSSIGNGLSLVLDSNAAHTGYHQANRCFDLFVILDGGVVRLATGPDWNSGAVAGSITQRGTGSGSTELELVNGFYVNKNTITARFNSAAGNTVSVPARRATYVGTFYAAGNGLATDSAEKRWLDNAYNQTVRSLRRVTTVGSWNYSVGSYQQANADVNNKVSWVSGLSGKMIDALLSGLGSTSTSTSRAIVVALGLDSTTTPAAECQMDYYTLVTPNIAPVRAKYTGTPGIGFHNLNWLERGGGADVQTWFGDSGATPSIYRQGISGSALF